MGVLLHDVERFVKTIQSVETWKQGLLSWEPSVISHFTLCSRDHQVNSASYGQLRSFNSAIVMIRLRN